MGEPRSWGEFMEALVKLVGQAADTGGSQTAGTVMAKENEIMEMLKNGGMRVVKSIQRGNAATNINTGQSITVSISAVDMEKSIVIASFFNTTTSGNNNTGGVISIASPTTLSIYAAAGSGSNYTTTSIRWQVIEFY